MNSDYLIEQIRKEIHSAAANPDLGALVVHVMLREGVDLLHEPTLEEMKRILTSAVRAEKSRLCVA